MKIKTLFVFDIDDTLTQTALLHQQLFIAALKGLGVEKMDTAFGEYKHHTDAYIAELIFEKDRNAAFEEKHMLQMQKSILAQIKNHRIAEIKGAKALVDYLEESESYGLCYATGSLHTPALYKLEQIGIQNFESKLAASNEIQERENIVKTAIELAKSFYGQETFEKVISVGDGLWDLKTARNLNLDFIGIGDRNRAALKEAKAPLLYSDLQEFLVEKLS